MPVHYKTTDKLSYVLANDYRLLQVMSRFGITLGFGEKTIEQVCLQCGVDTATFLAVINYVKDGATPVQQDVDNVSVPSLLDYLRHTHRYFLDYLFPHIRFHLLNAIDCSVKNEIAFLVLKFFDEYVEEVRKHMDYEETTVFAYVCRLVDNQALPADRGHLLSKHNESINSKLRELKKLFIQYYPQTENNERLNSVIISIYQAEEDLALHCNVEDYIFAPAVHKLERDRDDRVVSLSGEESQSNSQGTLSTELSAREQEIVVCVARGFSNKEIADKLCLSVNTVTTHRRNIARKLQIHSPSGLTIYAIVNKLVTLSEVGAV
ncbi:MAG: helix-turn-helix transcriptional regulator [Prevotellaceae bacterium]|nr:helix-turn-helix transcriptional regulator [Prevotellaceae bacterium]